MTDELPEVKPDETKKKSFEVKDKDAPPALDENRPVADVSSADTDTPTNEVE